jgi:hypothetical protein
MTGWQKGWRHLFSSLFDALRNIRPLRIHFLIVLDLEDNIYKVRVDPSTPLGYIRASTRLNCRMISLILNIKEKLNFPGRMI